jgi:hypothetical protein
VFDFLKLLKWMLLDLFRSRGSLEAEVIALRQQLKKRSHALARLPDEVLLSISK